ncbi:MAG TPA: hypothetical protein VGP88_01065 [Thermoplasmata archaeon]|jgi:hypothetical protein|nr:hypothetical protein [Thermoplasmata archaeon]
MAGAPTLWRLARLFRILALLWLVAVVVFLATVAYSGSKLRPAGESGPSAPPTFSGNDTITLTGEVNVSNPGWYPLSDLSLFTIVDEPNGSFLASGGSPVTTVSAGGTTTVPFTITLGLGDKPFARTLLTDDATLPSTTWANATYVSLIHVLLSVPVNVSWGAPLFGLNATPGNPTVEPNGTAAVPLTITFADHAKFPVDGTAKYSLSSGGAVCALGSLPVAVASGGSYDETTTAYLGPGCSPGGATLTLRFVGAGWALNPFPVVLR